MQRSWSNIVSKCARLEVKDFTNHYVRGQSDARPKKKLYQAQFQSKRCPPGGHNNGHAHGLQGQFSKCSQLTHLLLEKYGNELGIVSKEKKEAPAQPAATAEEQPSVSSTINEQLPHLNSEDPKEPTQQSSLTYSNRKAKIETIQKEATPSLKKRDYINVRPAQQASNEGSMTVRLNRKFQEVATKTPIQPAVQQKPKLSRSNEKPRWQQLYEVHSVKQMKKQELQRKKQEHDEKMD